MTFDECLSKSREWLVRTNNRLCRRVGLKAHHLTTSKVTKFEEAIVWDPDKGQTVIGYKFNIVRHPKHSEMIQTWKVTFDGALTLLNETPLKSGDPMKRVRIKHLGKMRYRNELWPEDSTN